MIRPIAFALLAVLAPSAAFAEPCANPDALGTARVLTVDVRSTPRVGTKHFPDTLPLRDKEIVLTFDDGPWPTTTPRVLNALKAECVRATFFLVGRNADDHPQIVRRALAEGHTIGHHTYSHPLLDHLSPDKTEAEINRGFASDDRAAYGRAQSEPATPFFRFPGFASTAALLGRLEKRGIVVFGADLWASDWVAMTPAEELQLLLARVDYAGRGIVLLHDTKAQTAAMLPAFLRELKKRGYRIVHVVPAGAPAVN